MELIAIYFIIQKIKARTEEYEYNCTPHIKLAVILWLAGEILGFLLGSIFFRSMWFLTYLTAVIFSSLGGFFVYYKVMNLPKRNVDYFDLRQTKTYPYLEPEGTGQTQALKPEMTQRIEKPVQRQEPDTREEDFTPFWMTQLNQAQQEKETIATQRFTKVQNETQSAPNQPMFAPNAAKGFQTPETKVPEAKPQEPKAPNFPFEEQKTPEYPFQDPKAPESRYQEPKATEFKMPEKLLEPKPRFEKKEENISYTGTNQGFKFPYNELLPVEDLLVGEFGLQTVKDRPVSDFDWFMNYKAKYDSHEVRGAMVILEKALYQNLDNGFIWLLYGVLYKDVYQNYEKALQFCLTGAKRCNTYKSALLTEAAEILLLGMHNIPASFTFFCHAVKAISEHSKAWGQSGATGAVSQERAFHYMRVLLTIYNFNDYRLYLERNVRFHTGLDQALIERVIALCSESTSRQEVEMVIRHLFPTIIEKMQSLG